MTTHAIAAALDERLQAIGAPVLSLDEAIVGVEREAVSEELGHTRALRPPRALLDRLDAEFGFGRGGAQFLLPTYDRRIGKRLAEARDAVRAGATMVCLVPARTDTKWFWDHCRYGEVRFLRGRLRFEGQKSSAPFPSAVVVFRPSGEPRVAWWDWRRGGDPEYTECVVWWDWRSGAEVDRARDGDCR